MKSGGCELKRNQLENSTMSQRAKTRQGSGVSLKKQILEWWAALPEPTTRKVAELCNTSVDYVRVVVRQRGETGVSQYDKAYLDKFRAEHGCHPRSKQYNEDPVFHAKHNAQSLARYHQRMANEPEYREQRNATRRQWIKDTYGGENEYRLFLRERRAAKASKERL
jgi:hypothetical protein